MKTSQKLSWLLVVTGPYLPSPAAPAMGSHRLSLVPASPDDIISELPPEEMHFRTIPSPPTEDIFIRRPPAPRPPPPTVKQDKWTPEGIAAATLCGAATATLLYKNREALGWYLKEQFSRLKDALPKRLQFPKR
jgi:hypothetical protein